MTRARIIDAIHAVLKDHMGNTHLAGFAPQSRLNEDLYLDSVLVLQVFLNLELEFGLAAPEEAIAASDLQTVADIAAVIEGAAAIRAPTAAPGDPDPSEGVHGEDYVDLKIHCFVSCVCAALKQVGIDHRAFYFGVWDADFGVGDDHQLRYHAPTISHEFFRQWYRRLYGVTLREWYDHDRSREDNLGVLFALLDARTPTQHIMVMLDMFHLPERENKFNQNPFPHYLMLETTEDPLVWQVNDPDFRWEGRIARDTVVNAITQPTVGGGYIFDHREARPAAPMDLKAYFEACFIAHTNPLTDATRRILAAHLDGTAGGGPGALATALRELPVLSIRKYAYEHGFAHYWRALKLPDAEFQGWCDEIEALALGFKALHYAILKLSQTADTAQAPAIFETLDRLDALERRIKDRLGEAHAQWCALHGLPQTGDTAPRRAVG
jgi:acyl carrier protein